MIKIDIFDKINNKLIVSFIKQILILHIITYPLVFGTPVGVTHCNFAKTLSFRYVESPGYRRHCLRDPMFRNYGRTLTCDRQTDRHMATAYTAVAYRRAVKMINK